MTAPRKFDEDTRARAVRMYADRLREHPGSKLAARAHVSELPDINPATPRNWVDAEEGADGLPAPVVRVRTSTPRRSASSAGGSPRSSGRMTFSRPRSPRRN